MKSDLQKQLFDQAPGKNRRSIRLPEYDYSHPGEYFVTMVAFRRECLFGEIHDRMMFLNEAGQIVLDAWNSLPGRYPTVTLGTNVVMPNHFHGIVMINEMSVGAIHELPLQDELPLHGGNRSQRRRMTLSLLIGYFKMNAAKQINKLLNSTGVPIWQRNYYEHIIRNDDEFKRIVSYIESNIDNWSTDDENPIRPK